MVDAYKHENIELISYAEVEEVDGYIGNFHVTIGKKQDMLLKKTVLDVDLV